MRAWIEKRGQIHILTIFCAFIQLRAQLLVQKLPFHISLTRMVKSCNLPKLLQLSHWTLLQGGSLQTLIWCDPRHTSIHVSSDYLSLGPLRCTTTPTIQGTWLRSFANSIAVSMSSVISIFSMLANCCTAMNIIRRACHKSYFPHLSCQLLNIVGIYIYWLSGPFDLFKLFNDCFYKHLLYPQLYHFLVLLFIIAHL